MNNIISILTVSSSFIREKIEFHLQLLNHSSDGQACRLWEVKKAGARGLGVFAAQFI